MGIPHFFYGRLSGTGVICFPCLRKRIESVRPYIKAPKGVGWGTNERQSLLFSLVGSESPPMLGMQDDCFVKNCGWSLPRDVLHCSGLQ